MNQEVGRSQSARPSRRKGPWSQAEIERLKRLYGLKPDSQIARELQRSVESLRRLARRIFSGKQRTGPWSAREVQNLKRYLGVARPEVMALVLRRSPQEIRRKIEDLQRQFRSGPWNSADVQTLKHLYGTRSNKDLALILGRSHREIDAKARQLCLAKDKGFRRRHGAAHPTRMPRWSEREKEVLRQLYGDRPNLEIARKLDRTVKSVVSKAHDLGLRKSKERLRKMGRDNVRVRYKEESDRPQGRGKDGAAVSGARRTGRQRGPRRSAGVQASEDLS
ncbi:MAG: hypothetical protein ACE5H3_08695 [Planctomycetota bacterium]